MPEETLSVVPFDNLNRVATKLALFGDIVSHNAIGYDAYRNQLQTAAKDVASAVQVVLNELDGKNVPGAMQEGAGEEGDLKTEDRGF